VSLFARPHRNHNRDALEAWNQVKCSLRWQRFETFGSVGADDQGATWLNHPNDLGIGVFRSAAPLRTPLTDLDGEELETLTRLISGCC
jgi:hypothetical protein